MKISSAMDEKVIETSPPLPPLPSERFEGDDSRLYAILTHDGEEYHVECLSRKFIAKFRFQDSDLGNVIYDEGGIILEYSEKELAPAIYNKLRVFIKCWKRSFPNF